MFKSTPPFHIVTPLIYSPEMSKIAGRDVYLKLDNLQPSGSFKIRGIGRTCEVEAAKGAKRFVGSSGGNAGIAMAHAAAGLGIPLSLFIPVTTPSVIADKLKSTYPVDLHVIGHNFFAANDAAKELLASDPSAVFIHPYDQESTWAGHSTLMHEIKEQLEAMGEKRTPAALGTCVGGGGLAIGLILGLRQVGWNNVPLIAMETTGSNCFHLSLKEKKMVAIDDIKTIAKSLGALEVTPKLLELATEHQIISRVVTDAEALTACYRFADDHRMLVEPACGAVLSSIYCDRIDLELKKDENPIVLVVCGGNMATFELFECWKKQLGM